MDHYKNESTNIDKKIWEFSVSWHTMIGILIALWIIIHR